MLREVRLCKICVITSYSIHYTKLYERKVAKIINDEETEVKVVSIDAFLCRSEIEFYHVFATEIIKQTSNKLEEWLDHAKKFLARLSPKFNAK